jgi:hypothetical protein
MATPYSTPTSLQLEVRENVYHRTAAATTRGTADYNRKNSWISCGLPSRNRRRQIGKKKGQGVVEWMA